jgi:polysaccharide pyruvyl transferase WcaK-like protein
MGALLAERVRVAPHPLRALFAKADAVLDISGGDSFTDIYGHHRLDSICAPKQLALRRRSPLILLPQTYGPFQQSDSRARAERIVRAASIAWARDERSFAVLRDLLGNAFDADRHRCGVDVAFLLPTERPPNALVDQIGPLATPRGDRDRPVLGLNVSGLIWKDPERARSAFHFKADYNAAVRSFVLRALNETDATIALMPHVVTASGHYESDFDAARELRDLVASQNPSIADRILVVPAVDDPRHAKWIISRCDWFCGTRMHATIAGLSSGVPTAAISYSPKTLGVFETCAMGEHVADPTVSDADEIVEHLLRSMHARIEARQTLAAALPGVIAMANEQFDHIVSDIRSNAEL